MCQEADNERIKGRTYATLLAQHLQAMDVAGCEIPVILDGEEYLIVAGLKSVLGAVTRKVNIHQRLRSKGVIIVETMDNDFILTSLSEKGTEFIKTLDQNAFTGEKEALDYIEGAL